MKTITIHQVVELNQQLQEKNLPFKIHMRDACGAQSFSVEPTGEGWKADREEAMRESIQTYFREIGAELLWTLDQKGFKLQ